MKVITDTSIATGSTHSVCQDYARGQSHGGQWAVGVIADGCSSSPMTEFGSKILTTCALDILNTSASSRAQIGPEVNQPFAESFAEWVMADARRSLNGIGRGHIPQAALDATLGVMLYRNGRLSVVLWGDGVLIHRTSIDGAPQINTRTVRYKSNAPYYLNVRTDVNKARQYHEQFDEPMYCDFVSNSSSQSSTVDHHYADVITWQFEPKVGDTFLLSTDGVESFIDAEGAAVDIKSIAEEVMDFKRFNPEFLQGRMKFFHRHSAQAGRRHRDDLGMVAMHFEDEN